MPLYKQNLKMLGEALARFYRSVSSNYAYERYSTPRCLRFRHSWRCIAFHFRAQKVDKTVLCRTDSLCDRFWPGKILPGTKDGDGSLVLRKGWGKRVIPRRLLLHLECGIHGSSDFRRGYL
jgi:hypothetical protein